MDLDLPTPSTSTVKCCDCGCSCQAIMNRSLSGTMLRSVKRKFNDHEVGSGKFVIPGLGLPQNARVEIENECTALREMVSSQQKTIQDLCMELEEERNAASSAANEAMSMMLRLQREKAEVQMEARQFKRLVEEKMAHDQHELEALEDLLYKREETIQSLSCEVQIYKHRMMSFGLSEAEVDGERIETGLMSRNNSMAGNLDGQFEFPTCEYPSLRCNLTESQVYFDVDDESMDVEKYAFGETPRPRDQLKDLEFRINQLERSPRCNQPEGDFTGNKDVLEKVIVGQSPRLPRHRRRFSTDSSNSFFSKCREIGPDLTADSPRFCSSFRKKGYSYMDEYSNLRKCDNASDHGEDIRDRVYNIDSVHPGATPKYGITEPVASVGLVGDYDMATPRYSMADTNMGDPDFQKLYARLQALEADRESMRQAIISMRTDKAQLVLLKEISQHLLKEMSPQQKPPITKSSIFGSFCFFSIFKWIVSFVLWRKKARRCKYTCGFSDNNAGLLMLLDERQKVGQWKHLWSMHA